MHVPYTQHISYYECFSQWAVSGQTYKLPVHVCPLFSSVLVSISDKTADQNAKNTTKDLSTK